MNAWRIPSWLEREVRDRDRACVYCTAEFATNSSDNGSRGAVATLEHIINDARIVTRENIALCCASCNSSKGAKTLSVWILSSYCVKKGITAISVAPIIRQALLNANTVSR